VINGIKLFLCLLGVASVSCATRAPDVPVQFNVPASFSRTGEDTAPEAWWEAFGDAALNDWMREALDGNLNLRASWDRLAQAEAMAARQGAGLRPTLDANAAAGRTRTEPDGGGRNIYKNEFSVGLVASYEIDMWGRVRSARDAAALDVDASAELIRATAITLAAEIATTWIQRTEQAGQVALLEQQLETNERILSLLRQRFRSGRSSAVDVLQQEQLVEARRGDLATAKSRLEVLEHQLAVLAGRPVNAPLPETGLLPSLPPVPEAGVPADLLQRRPDVLRAFYQVMAADQRVSAAIADRFPRLSITARASTTAPDVDDLFSNWLSSLAANLVGPIIDGGSLRAETARSRAALSESIHLYGQAVLTALAEVEDALAQERRQQELLESLVRQLELANQVTGRVRDRYLSGGEDFLRILTADLTQQNLERNVLTARRQLIEFRIGLYRALSGGFPLERPGPATLNQGSRS
jgi:NodT family efflux transporter outer membrane factor (OMF) lipoprotein